MAGSTVVKQVSETAGVCVTFIAITNVMTAWTEVGTANNNAPRYDLLVAERGEVGDIASQILKQLFRLAFMKGDRLDCNVYRLQFHLSHSQPEPSAPSQKQNMETIEKTHNQKNVSMTWLNCSKHMKR
jgi:hypothetical protein